MDQEHLNYILAQYIKQFHKLNRHGGNDEGYKWRAARCFAENWDIDADDFPAMFQASVKEADNLLDTRTMQPTGGIRLLFDRPGETEFVRACFRELFADDGGDLALRQERILRFAEQINARIAHYMPGSWRYPQKFNHVLTYLNLRYPSENYLYKASVASDWATCIAFADDFGHGASFSLAKYYRMCDELLAVVSGNEELMRLQAQRLAREAGDVDDRLHMLVYDIMYCTQYYHLYADGMLNAAAAREHARRERKQAELDALYEQLAQAEQTREARIRSAHPAADMTGSEVLHRAFGQGVVIRQTDDRQIIAFPGGEKKFSYPDAYLNGFLQADAQMMDEIRRAAAETSEIAASEAQISKLRDRIVKRKNEA